MQTSEEDCLREQSRCEAELALQAGRVGPGPVPGGRPGRPVCGSDNTTYDNDCHLKRVQCEGSTVEVAHRGKCKGEYRGGAGATPFYLAARAPSL